MSGKNAFPYEIEDVDVEIVAEMSKYFTSPTNPVLVGPEKYYFSNGYRIEGPKIYNMEVRPTDTFVVTFPKSGTTWTQELVWLLQNDVDFDTAKAKTLHERYSFVDISMFFNNDKFVPYLKEKFNLDEKAASVFEMMKTPARELLENIPVTTPRFIKSHLPLSLLPPTLLDTTKVIYVARDPRDVAVSFYHHAKLYKIMGYEGDFKTYWHYFHNNLIDWTPVFPHVKEAWSKRDHPNMLFLFYEELIKDLPACISRVASFLGKSVTDDQLEKLCKHLSFENFKKNPAVNYEELREFGVLAEGQTFVRKGKAGGWRGYFDEEMTAQAQRWIDDNLRGSDLTFPSVE